MAKKSANSNLITALLYILIGLVFLIFGAEVLNWAMTIAGVLFIVFGALEIVKKNMIAGIISIVIGIVIILGGWLFLEIVLLVLGILIAIKGLIALINAIKAKKKSVFDILFATLTIIAGILLAFGNAGDIIIKIGGVLLIVNGVLELLGKGMSKK